MPFTDFSDPLNLRRGNADLRPEFTNSLELSYQNIFNSGHNVLVSLYYKQVSDLITSYQYAEFNDELGQDVLVNSYANSLGSKAYGMELTVKNTFFKNLELTSNLNLYNSEVDASNVETDLMIDRFSWFLKENLTVKLPKDFTLQLSGQYQSPAAFSPTGGGRFGHWRGSVNTAQGYRISYWFVDAALRKNILNRKGALTLSIQDIFGSRKTGTYTESDFFIQDTWRLRNPQLMRLNFSYRFGKMDTSLFKRKNTRTNNEGMDMMQ
jgi:outer membrane receptor for ferrienterochelin and colicin